MKNKMKWFATIGLAVFAFNGFAQSDPVSWSLSPSTGFPPVAIGNASSVTYTLKNNIPKGPVTITTSFLENPKSNFTILDKCNGQSLAYQGSCTVKITFNPTDASTATVQMSYQYNNNVIPLPVLKVEGSGTAEVVGVISGLPASISLTQSPIVTITYTNTSHGTAVTGWAGDDNGNNAVSTNPTSVATIAIIPNGNHCGTKLSPFTLQPQGYCTVQAKISPQSLGSFSVAGLFTYNNGSQNANPTANSQVVTTPPPPKDCLSAKATIIFPSPNTYQYSDNVLQFQFTNSCDSPTSTLPTVTFTSSGSSSSPTILGNPNNAAFDGCSGNSIPAHSSCTVLVSVLPQNTGTLSITASASTVTATTNTTNVVAPGYNHNFTFINNCPFTVWYGVTTPPGSSDPTPNPSPAAYALSGQVPEQPPATKTISFGSNSYGGILVPRTGCSIKGGNLVCSAGDCGSGANGQCSDTAYEPFTRIEEVLYIPESIAQGNYDIALENGASIPVEFKGLGPSTNVYTNPAASFVCSGAGAPIPIPFTNPPYNFNNISLGSCPWTYSVPNVPAGASTIFNYVSADTVVSDCSSCSETCGLAYADIPPVPAKVVLACGKLLGYWSLDQFASLAESSFSSLPAQYNPYTVFKFDSFLTSANGFQSGYPPTATVKDLYSCTPTDSVLSTCYPSVEGTYCCGSQNWNGPGSYGSFLTAQASDANKANPDWTNPNATLPLPLSPYASISWLKQACPTNYSYPWDDQSSSFNCNYSDAAQTQAAAMDFEVVFCPGGIVGALSVNP